MNIVVLAERRRSRDFEIAAEAVTPFGFAISSGDHGIPQVMATVSPVRSCPICRCDMPTGHMHALAIDLGDSVDRLALSSRARNALRRERITTVGELVALKADELLDIRQFGTGCLAEVVAELARHDLALKPAPAVALGEPLRRRMHAEVDVIEPAINALSLIRARTRREGA